MEMTQTNARKAALYGGSLVLAAVVPALVRSLLRRASPALESSPVSSTESEAIVSGIDKGYGTGIFVAAVVGAAVGAGVALLLAPRSGKASREWLAGSTRALGVRAGILAEKSMDVVPNGEIPS